MKIHVPIIAFNGNVHTEFMFSMMALQQHFIKNNYQATFYPITFESLISRARNAAAADFLAGDSDYMFFVDTDMTFTPDDFELLIKQNKEICVGAYPKKYLNSGKLQYISKNVNDQKVIDNIEKYSTDFSSEINYSKKLVEECIEVGYAATGFMLIKRSALLNIIEKFPNIEYKNDIDGCGLNKNKFYNFSQVGITSETKYLSEDYGFCELHKLSGGKLHCVTNTNLTHIGRKFYEGNLYEQSILWNKL